MQRDAAIGVDDRSPARVLVELLNVGCDVEETLGAQKESIPGVPRAAYNTEVLVE